ncbi:MAG: REP-associated tyrosine transposase [Stellaceae bacterium]
MPEYRRNRVPGGTFFFTVNLLDRRSDLLVTQIDALREAVRRVRARAPFQIDAWVVLPDHVHCLWTLPENDTDFPGRWRAIKKGFSKAVGIGEPRSPVMIRRGERGIYLAAAILGAHDPRRPGFDGAYGLHSLQSGEAGFR